MLKHSYVSLYSGCGGLDYGFHKLNFKLLFANDFHKDSCESFEKFYKFTPVCADLNNIKEQIPKADVIIGGPPCQSFSLLGKRNPDDERGKEMINFIELIKLHKPKVFILENVPGLKNSSFNQVPMLDYLDSFFLKLDYQTLNKKFDCTQFFIPQTRKRQIMIGWKKELRNPVFPSMQEFKKFLGFPEDFNEVLVGNALDDLPIPERRPEDKFKVKAYYKTNPSNPYQTLLRSNKGFVENHFRFHMSPLDKEYINHISPGGNYNQIPDEVSSPRIMRIKEKGGRTTTYGRLHPKKFSATINTYFNRPNVGTNYHYSQKRLITPREAMRLQSFPDDFVLSTSSIRSICMQIGNAVPPILSLYLALSVKSILD